MIATLSNETEQILGITALEMIYSEFWASFIEAQK
ncbi:MAG: hypothetical protein RIR39_1498 [Pseudomonadota bacterium]|jgi:hypothetical protein